VKIELALTIAQGHLSLDFAGTDPQVIGSKNVPMNALLAIVYTVVKSLVDPGLPANAGYYRAISVVAPEGSVLNPLSPAAVGTRSIVGGVVGDVIAGALSQAMPDKALAGCGPHHLMTQQGWDPRTGQPFVSYETFAGALGARPYQDGMDVVRVHASGAANLPVECLEHAYPFQIVRYEILTDSGGGGRFRGGAGMRRDYRCMGADVRIALCGERQRTGAPGLAGGNAGEPGVFILDPDTPHERKLPSVLSDLALAPGQILSIRTPGGGGWGDPDQRPADTVLQDVLEERVSASRAVDEYGVAITRDGARADLNADVTARLRATRSKS
jgi:N-methylhydantoinase B